MKRMILALMIFFTSIIALAAITQKDPSGIKAYSSNTEIATFAGGCFWCMEPPFDMLKGVISTTSGYIDGHKENPTYQQVSTGTTGHTEALQIEYDSSKITYVELLAVFWKNIDPTTPDQQFCDRGSQYRSAVFYHDDAQKLAAEKSFKQVEKTKPFKEPIVTQLKMASMFYPAEDYHQDYYQKNPLRYKYYRHACGRDARLEEIWGKK